MANVAKFAPVKDAIFQGISKLGKWYSNVKECDTYFVCIGLPYFTFYFHGQLTYHQHCIQGLNWFIAKIVGMQTPLQEGRKA